jgi:hypothetical protein
MDIQTLIKDRGLHITIKDNPLGHNPPKIIDDDGYSSLLWDRWGVQMKLSNGHGFLLYINDSELKDG